MPHKLKQSEFHLQQIESILQEGYVIQDKTGKIVSFNQKACEILGLTEDQMLGRESFDPRWKSIKQDGSDFPGDEHPAMVTLKTGKALRKVFMGVQKPVGNRVWIEINSDPFRLENSQVADAVITTFKDVTDYFELMNYYKRSTDQLEEAQKVAQIGSWSYDLETNKIEWTPQMYELFPESREKGEPSYERHYSTIHPDDRQHWKNTVEKCVMAGEPYRMHFRAVHPTKIVWIEAVGRGIKDKNGKMICLVGTCRDITQQRKLEEDLNTERSRGIHASKLASLGEMAAGIAHEINNPLAIIAASVDLVPRLLNEPEKLNSKIDFMHKSIARITKIVNGLRKFSRVTSERYYLKKDWVSIVEECLVLTAGKTRKCDVQVEKELLESCMIVCDEVEMEQVIVNLISNAADALKEIQGNRVIKVRMLQDGEWAHLQIHDSGSGVPEDKKQKIFEPFFTTKKIGEGTGLGLSIAKGIIDEHKGKLELLPSEKGALFQVSMKLWVPVADNANR